LLARFSGQGGIDAIYAMSDTIANGAVQAATAAGVKVGTGKGDLLIVGGSCQTPGIRNIEAGKMYATMLVAPSIEGKLGADAAADVLDGKPVKKLQSGPHAIVDPTNVKKYEDLCVF
jgi:ribose transport system substrate-binding protein